VTLLGDGAAPVDNTARKEGQRVQSNFEQAANLLCAQVNSASYAQWDEKCRVQTMQV